MALGPGKYDAMATAAREQTHAAGVVLVVIDGEHGHGFSVQGSLALTLNLPALLREIADQIEADMRPAA